MVSFREEHPDWSIETEFISVTESAAYVRATVRDEKGRIIATSHKFENSQGFADFIEKAETGAIGRALALIGYGTQFCADELDEGKRIVDSPIEIQQDPGEFQINFGRKYKGRKISTIPKAELENYLQWLQSKSVRAGTRLYDCVNFLKDAYERYYSLGTDKQFRPAVSH